MALQTSKAVFSWLAAAAAVRLDWRTMTAPGSASAEMLPGAALNSDAELAENVVEQGVVSGNAEKALHGGPGLGDAGSCDILAKP